MRHTKKAILYITIFFLGLFFIFNNKVQAEEKQDNEVDSEYVTVGDDSVEIHDEDKETELLTESIEKNDSYGDDESDSMEKNVVDDIKLSFSEVESGIDTELNLFQLDGIEDGDEADASMLATEMSTLADNKKTDGEYVSVKSYGAVGDGTTDDSDAIQLAYEVAIVQGKTLYFPNGTYYMSQNLLLDENCTIKGESKEKTVLLFRDTVKKYAIDPWNQRGIVTFNSSKLSVENISFKYIADNSTAFTREKNQTGDEGVLFSIIEGNSISIKNCGFYVGGKVNPSITCMWIKAEKTNISNVKIDGCKFVNDTESTVGGCLWISSHDKSNLSVSDITVSNCDISKNGNDEALSVWGYKATNINIYQNRFEYYGKNIQNDVFIAFGMPTGKTELLKKIYFTNNEVYLNGWASTVLKVQVLASDSDIHVSDNRIDGTVTKTQWFSCFTFNRCANVYLTNNVIDISGPDVLAYMTYAVGGNIENSGNSFTTETCKRSMIIKSLDSKFFDNANVTFNGDRFSFGDTNTVSEQSMIQYPASGRFIFSKCVVDTSRSFLHEFKYQLLTKTTGEPVWNRINITDCEFDCGLMFRLNKFSNTGLYLNRTKCKNINFMVPEGKKCLAGLDLTDVTCNLIRFNYVEAKRSNLRDISGYLIYE